MTLVEQRTRGSLRDVLRAFMLNPAACDSVLNDTSLVQLRSEAASEIAQQLKVSVTIITLLSASAANSLDRHIQ